MAYVNSIVYIREFFFKTNTIQNHKVRSSYRNNSKLGQVINNATRKKILRKIYSSSISVDRGINVCNNNAGNFGWMHAAKHERLISWNFSHVFIVENIEAVVAYMDINLHFNLFFVFYAHYWLHRLQQHLISPYRWNCKLFLSESFFVQ